MTIKQQGGIFGRNPTFNNVEASEIIATNNLGINTSSPQRPLDVLAGSFNTGVAHFSGSFSDRGLFLSTDVSGTRNDGAVKYDASSGASGSFGQHQFLTDGGLVATIKSVGIALENGKGIDFSATSGTGTSELFDDYEEGTWTPVYTTTGTDFASVTYDPLTAGRYVKIGNVVHISGYIRTDALDATSATGTVLISGLPFATAVINSDTKSMGAIATSRAQNFNGMSGFPFLHPRSGASYMYLLDGDRIDVPIAEMLTGANGNIVAFAGTYMTE